MPFLSFGDCVHHYVAQGAADKPALVFANSLGSDLRIWDGVAARLVDNFRIVRYDKRSHGLSDGLPSPYTIEELAADLAGVLDALEIRAAIVCGISVGGLIAQCFALTYPERTRALVLCDTGAKIGTVVSWEQRMAVVRADGLQPLEAMSMERWFTREFRESHPDEVRGYANMLLGTSVEGYIGTCCALRDADLTERASRIKQPALVVSGAADIATPPELGQELARLIPGAKFSLIKDAAHLPCIEQPQALAEKMIKYFREVQIV